MIGLPERRHGAGSVLVPAVQREEGARRGWLRLEHPRRPRQYLRGMREQTRSLLTPRADLNQPVPLFSSVAGAPQRTTFPKRGRRALGSSGGADAVHTRANRDRRIAHRTGHHVSVTWMPVATIVRGEDAEGLRGPQSLPPLLKPLRHQAELPPPPSARSSRPVPVCPAVPVPWPSLAGQSGQRRGQGERVRLWLIRPARVRSATPCLSCRRRACGRRR